MAALFKSYVTPLVILFAVPLGLVGVVPMLYLTNTAINVQSLLGVIFMVGIVVSNTVLLVDFAQNLRVQEGLTPDQAIRKAASIRARPVLMTALAAFFALIPMALALERGSEANAPLGRAVIGGILAGLVTTLFVVPSLYSLVVRDTATDTGARAVPRRRRCVFMGYDLFTSKPTANSRQRHVMSQGNEGESVPGPATRRPGLVAQEEVWTEVLELAAAVESMLNQAVQALCEGSIDLCAQSRIKSEGSTNGRFGSRKSAFASWHCTILWHRISGGRCRY